jgi:hypothetical protein
MLKQVSGHYIVCGAGRVGRSVVSELIRSEASAVLIDDNAERAKWGDELGVLTLIADATKDETLRKARIDVAKGLVAAISSDAENVYVALSAKVLNPGLLIAGAGERRSGRRKAKACRCDHRIHALFVHWASPGSIHSPSSRHQFSRYCFDLPSSGGYESGDRATPGCLLEFFCYEDSGAVRYRQEVWSYRTCRAASERLDAIQSTSGSAYSVRRCSDCHGRAFKTQESRTGNEFLEPVAERS